MVCNTNFGRNNTGDGGDDDGDDDGDGDDDDDDDDEDEDNNNAKHWTVTFRFTPGYAKRLPKLGQQILISSFLTDCVF